MVATRSSRSSSSRLSKKLGSVVDTSMEGVDMKESGATNAGAGDGSPEDKKDIGCKQCLEEEEDPSKPIAKKASLVRFNEVVETREVETEYDKPNRTMSYIKGFVQRVIICSLFVMFCKITWPQLQPMVWPEAPVKEGKLYILNDKSFRSHVSKGDHFVMMMAPWCGHCKKLKPDWDKLARQPGVSGLSISKVDCTQSKATCDKYNVNGYPTLLYFRNGEMIARHSGDKDFQSLKDYVKTMKGERQTAKTEYTKQKPKPKTKKDTAKKEL